MYRTLMLHHSPMMLYILISTKTNPLESLYRSICENNNFYSFFLLGYMEVDKLIALFARIIDENEPTLIAARAERLVFLKSKETF